MIEQFSLELPDDIHACLADELVLDDSFHAHRNTEKYTLDRYPDLFVRLNREGTTDDIAHGTETAHALREFGVHVLPAQVVEHDDEAYVITLRVTGTALNELPETTWTSEMTSQLDTLWHGIGYSLITNYGRDTPYAPDIYDPCQFMLGTTPVNPAEPWLWLTDIPANAAAFKYSDEFPEEVMYLTRSIVEVESLVSSRLSKARQMLEIIQSVAEDTTVDDWTKLLVNASKYMIRYGKSISPHDQETIESLPLID